MPEGPEIRRLRDRLADAIQGEIAQRIEFHLPALSRWNGRLDGCCITRIESRGKALLTHLDSGHSLYSHNQLYGRWFIVPPGESPETNRQLRLAIHTRRNRALLYSASDIEVWPTERLREHPFLQRLGPDVLEENTTIQTIMQRLREKPWWRRRLGGFLTDQSFVAGLGNYLRCEILFVAGLHPAQRPCDLDEEQLGILANAILELPRQSYATGGITNDLTRAEELRSSGASFEEYRFHLFRRAGLPCYRCGTPIRFEKRSGQGCYYCPGCQKAP